MRVVGYVRGGGGARDDCDQPLRWVCRVCEHVEIRRCHTYGCSPCSESKRRDLARLIEDGSGRHLASGLHAYFITFTAPGVVDHLRWYQGRRPAHRQVCGCHHHGLTLGQWNAQESACWNRFRTALARSASVHYVGAVEPQQRGALHRHVVLFADRVLVHAEVQEIALAAGYGCVLDVEPLESVGKVSRYLTKYVTKGATGRARVPWSRWRVDQGTGEMQLRKVPTYRLWSSSQRWGITLTEIRAAKAAQSRNRAMYLRELTALLAEDIAAAAPGAPPSQGLDPP